MIAIVYGAALVRKSDKSSRSQHVTLRFHLGIAFLMVVVLTLASVFSQKAKAEDVLALEKKLGDMRDVKAEELLAAEKKLSEMRDILLRLDMAMTNKITLERLRVETGQVSSPQIGALIENLEHELDVARKQGLLPPAKSKADGPTP